MLRATISAPMLPADRADYERTIAALCTDLGPDAFTAAWEAGGSLPPTAAVAEATTEAAAILGGIYLTDSCASRRDRMG